MKIQILNILSANIICLLLLTAPCLVQAQISNSKFRAVNRIVSLDKSEKIVRVNEVDGVGIAWILDKKFTAGEIEFDIKRGR